MSANQNYEQPQDSTHLSLINEPIAHYEPSRISTIRKGLKHSSLQEFISNTGLARAEFATIAQISTRTLQRYDTHQRLSPSVSEKLIQLIDLYQLASDSLGYKAKEITKWLKTSNTALGGEKPLNLLDTYIGYQQVFQLLGRISHGVFS